MPAFSKAGLESRYTIFLSLIITRVETCTLRPCPAPTNQRFPKSSRLFQNIVDTQWTHVLCSSDKSDILITCFAGAVEQPADRQVSGDQEAISLSLEERLLAAECKIVDFGNGCWTSKHFTDDIQTRQYRCPEVTYNSAVVQVC